MIRRVLFVDDEPNVLRALKLLLRRQVKQWEMVFAPDADHALAELERVPFDLVISDMRMPRIDGAELLTRVAERWPRTGRVILSGYADEDAMQRAMKVAHKWLSKPCDLPTLLAAVAELEALGVGQSGLTRVPCDPEPASTSVSTASS